MIKQFFILLALALGLSACSNYNYYAVSNKKLTSAYKSFAWLPESKSKATKIYDNDVATDKIVEATSRALEQRGLNLDNKNPDLLIKYTAVVNNTVKQYNEPVYYNAPPYFAPRMGFARGRAFYYYSYVNPMPIYVGSEMRKVNVKEGSVIIDLIDRKTGKVIWRGWSEGEVGNPEKAINDIPKVVDGIFRKLSA
jgi:PBP1b-binding outer membrane lipoprotein LpoB